MSATASDQPLPEKGPYITLFWCWLLLSSSELRDLWICVQAARGSVLSAFEVIYVLGDGV